MQERQKIQEPTDARLEAMKTNEPITTTAPIAQVAERDHPDRGDGSGSRSDHSLSKFSLLRWVDHMHGKLQTR